MEPFLARASGVRVNLLLYGSLALRGAGRLRRHFGARLEIVEAGDDDDPETLAAKFAAAEAIISVTYASDLPPAPKLRLLQLPASGHDMVELDAVPAGAAIANVYEHEVGIAEYVFAGMLEWTVGLRRRDARFRAGDWAENPRVGGATRPELKGKTIALVGYGRIGRAIAQRARAFGMWVLAATRTPRPIEPEPDALVAYGELARIVPGCDFLVVCCPLSDETEGLVDSATIALMRPEAVLFNVARGPIVDQAALYQALREGGIAGAVYASPGAGQVRPADHPFEALENVIMTPHLSGWTTGQKERRWARMIENIERLMDGRPLLNELRPAGEDHHR
jgi:phosphoglycerate dehydrogenase-like enzyme